MLSTVFREDPYIIVWWPGVLTSALYQTILQEHISVTALKNKNVPKKNFQHEHHNFYDLLDTSLKYPGEIIHRK